MRIILGLRFKVLIYKAYDLSTWQMLEKQGDHFFFIKFPQQNYVLYNMIFCLFRNASVEKSVPVLSFETHPYQIPYTHHHFEKNPSTFRTRTEFVESKMTRSVSVLILKLTPFPLRPRTRTWVRVRKVYGIRTRIPGYGLNTF